MENNKTHILIVDDDDRIRSLLKEYLVENNYLVSTSENAESAKKKLIIFKFDLIVLDVMMPGQNGYDLTKLEQMYAVANGFDLTVHRNREHITLRQDWFTDIDQTDGPHINHCYMFERKGYKGKALEQLTAWAKNNSHIHKLIALKPKWGLDFSIDYCDIQGNVFEVFKWSILLKIGNY